MSLLRNALVVLILTVITSPMLADEPPPMLLGTVDAAALQAEPYGEWYQSGYDDYTPDAKTLDALKSRGDDGQSLTIFFGTWCGDSRREVPRLMRLLDAMGWPEDQRRLVAVDRSDDLHKRSPDGEERGYEVYRVPTVVVEHQDHEKGRIVEHPVLSLERDLLAILDQGTYTPSYASYPVVQRWLQDGLLSDANVNADGLASEVRDLVANEWELYSAARVLWTRGDVDEAAKLAAVNCSLYWDLAPCHMQLAEAQIRAGHLKEARNSTLRAMRRNTDPERVDTLVDLIERSMVPEAESDSDG